jgi:hypothetical protein
MSQQSHQWKKLLSQLDLDSFIHTFEGMNKIFEILILFFTLIIEYQFDDQSFFNITEADLVTIIPTLGPRRKLWSAIDKTKSGMIYVCFEYKEGLHNLLNHFKISHRLNSSSSIYECIHMFNMT